MENPGVKSGSVNGAFCPFLIGAQHNNHDLQRTKRLLHKTTFKNRQIQNLVLPTKNERYTEEKNFKTEALEDPEKNGT